MKKHLQILVFLFISFSSFAQPIGIIESNKPHNIYELFNHQEITIHFYQDNFAIISGNYKGDLSYHILEENGFNSDFNYFIHKISDSQLEALKKSVSQIGEVLYYNKTLSVIKLYKESVNQFTPLNKHSLIYFEDTKAQLPTKNKRSNFPKVSYSEDIALLINDVNSDSIEATIEYLSSFSTRDCFSDEIDGALNWIDSKFKSYNLNTSKQDISRIGIPSFNVIATQEGITSSDRYVVVGAHADSKSNDSTAPGADDDASGVAGVLEIARILSSQTFDYTIVYCAFSGEEYGLYGSKYFANDYVGKEKDIIGYVNLDMIGYKAEGIPMGTSLIYPTTAEPLASYYKNICSTYLPDFSVQEGKLIGGDSDHTSFNNAGYMGIFPFENDQHYSPYIHTRRDLLGLSVNNLELAKNFTSAALASVASLASTETTVSINDNLANKELFNIFPNPASSELNITGISETTQINIYNITGNLFISKEINSNDQIDISDFASGTYIIKFSTEKFIETKLFNVK